MDNEDIAKFFIFTSIGFVLGLLSGCTVVTSKLHLDAIEANCGHYNPFSGCFEWGPLPIIEEKDDNNL